jgi:two-component system LytT family sensor kinase
MGSWKILFHIFLGAAVATAAVLLYSSREGGTPNFFFIPRIVFIYLEPVAFYFNFFFLYPAFLLKKKVKTYLAAILATALLIEGIFVAVSFSLHQFGATPWIPNLILKFFTTILIMGVGTSYRLIVGFIYEKRVQHEQLKTELAFLRSQVSPHFMFNTLNSLVSLSRKRSADLEPALMELSNLMHYMLYESEQEKVKIENEIKYIKSYIDLQTLRFGNRMQIDFTAPDRVLNYTIEPMLLIPLIENAFKHAADIRGPFIKIDVTVEEKSLNLSVINHFNPVRKEKDKTDGIGLQNLKRRLNLLYPGRNELELRKHNNTFSAFLKIQLNAD